MNDDLIFKALADENRRRIVSALCREPMVAGELGRMVGLAPNAVSFHLKELRSAGLVSIKREGRFLRYQINAAVLSDWQQRLEQLFSLSAETSETRLAEQSFDSRQGRAGDRPEKPASQGGWLQDDNLPTELL